MEIWVRILYIVWASPNSAIGLFVGLFGIASGGKCQVKSGCLEFYGGWVEAFLKRCPNSPAAMTLGHIILGRDQTLLDNSRAHEQVHVRDYSRWGPFFLPAYLACSVGLWLTGRRAYRDNPFEIQAYNEAD